MEEVENSILLNTANSDLTNVSDIQRRIHEPDPSNPKEEINGRFNALSQKISLTTDIDAPVTPNTEGNTTTYTIDPMFHQLRYVTIRALTIPLRVRPEHEKSIQICWQENLLFNIILYGCFMIDNDPAMSVDDIYLHIDENLLFYDPKPGGRELAHEMIGNLPFLTKWATILPQYPLRLKVPFSFNRDDRKAIPLFRATDTKFKFKFIYRLFLKDLLRMRQFNDRTQRWDHIPFAPKYLEGVPSVPKLPVPMLFAKYGQMTKSEINIQLQRFPEYRMFIDDVYRNPEKGTKKYGIPITIPLNTVDPCKFLAFVAENVKSTRARRYGNFTTNSEDPSSGWNPIGTYSLDYGGSVRIPTTPTDFSDGLNPLCDLPSCPFRAGYNGISFASDLRNMDVDICRSLKRVNANLVLTLKNTDPFLATVSSTDGNLDESSVEESSIDNPPTPTDDSEFIIHVRGLVVRELLFKNNRCYVVSESKNQVNN